MLMPTHLFVCNCQLILHNCRPILHNCQPTVLRGDIKTQGLAIAIIHDSLQMVATFRNEIITTYKLLMLTILLAFDKVGFAYKYQ